MSSSVKKAFAIIQYVAGHQGELTLSELGRQLKVNKTTMFRYLETLESLDLLEKRDGSWFLGMELFSLGHKVDIQSRIVEKVHPVIFNYSVMVNETLSFAGFVNGAAIYFDKVESSRGLQMRARLGDRLPFHCTALGKAILSVLPEDTREDVLRHLVFAPYTAHTITNKEELLYQIDAIKEKGYSLEQEELEPGLSCIGVPLYVDHMNFYGAVSFSGASSHLTEERMMALVEVLGNVADEITGTLKTNGSSGDELVYNAKNLIVSEH